MLNTEKPLKNEINKTISIFLQEINRQKMTK